MLISLLLADVLPEPSFELPSLPAAKIGAFIASGFLALAAFWTICQRRTRKAKLTSLVLLGVAVGLLIFWLYPYPDVPRRNWRFGPIDKPMGSPSIGDTKPVTEEPPSQPYTHSPQR